MTKAEIRVTSIRQLATLVNRLTGVQLPVEKDQLIEKRLERRRYELGLDSLDEYFVHFRAHQDAELKHIVSLLTTHTTEFFREPGHFTSLVQDLLPNVVGEGSKTISIWSAACSTGEEVYSIAIALAEFKRTLPKSQHFSFRVLGTDVDAKSVEKAREGIFDVGSIASLNPDLRSRYFEIGSGELAGLCRLKEDIWRSCDFQTYNLFDEKLPVQSWNGIFLRNVLIYFSREDADRIVQRLGSALSPSGWLFLGAGESFIPHGGSLKRVAKSIYARPQKGAVARTQSPLKGAFTASSIAKVEDALKAKVVVVDDSATIRKIMRSILTPEFGFEVVAEAEDPTRLREIISKTDADLVTLDLHMPKMDGMTYLMNGLDEAHPPVVVLSSLSRSEGSKVLQCLEYGACDYIEKPRSNNFSESAELIRSALRGALQAKRSKAKPNDPVKVEAVSYQSSVKRRDLIVLGASTGGVDAIRQILPAFPLNSPPIVIVQHIPAVFSELMAERLCDVTKLIVKEAKDGDALLPGHVYIAPGGQQIELHSLGGQSKIVVSEAQTRLVYNPCIDFFFDSVARVAQLHHLTVSAAILTGMGRDGALGLKALKAMGAFTVAQDEATSVIYGMPRAAFELGAANLVCPLSQIPSELIKGLQNSKRAVA